ncbi:hypothetical protein HGA92_05080 [Candidatus Gracilibacteria bacterium]|nr:hypothetical protein [Candidatus Gracilibacteria bacterium]NUJ98394.1 hypothetical protein [Candidatus Gracilibacteria bacterium]
MRTRRKACPSSYKNGNDTKKGKIIESDAVQTYYKQQKRAYYKGKQALGGY